MRKLGEIAQWVVAVLMIAAASSCSISRKADKVMKNPEQFQRVGLAFIKQNPLDLDTQYVYLPGKTIEVIRIERDTVIRKVPCKDFTDTTINGVRITVKDGVLVATFSKKKEAPDTVVRYIENLKRVNLLEEDLKQSRSETGVLRVVINDQEIRHNMDKDALKRKIRDLNIRFYSMLAMVVLMIGAGIYIKVSQKKLFGK